MTNLLPIFLTSILTAQATVFGWVRAEGSLEPVPFAAVELAGRTALTDAHGYYAMAGVEPGSARLRAAMIGYRMADTTVVVPEDGRLRVDLLLTPEAVSLGTIEVAGTREELGTVATPGMPPVRIDAPTLNMVPALAEKDAFRAIQLLPSVAAASDFSSALYIRGGSPDQNLILVDGAPLFNPYHLGGLFSAIDPDAIATLEVIPGGIPASEGDRASSVVKVWTRDGGRDRVRSHGALGLVSSRLGVDGPLPWDGGSYLVSARRTYFDLITKAAYELDMIPTPFPYSFTDAHAKITQDVGLTGRLNVSGYINDERIHVPREVEPDSRTAWAWGTRAGSVAYRQPIGAAVMADVSVAGTSFDGAFDVIEDHTMGLDTLFFGRITMRDVVATAGLTWYLESHEIRAGIQADDYEFEYDFLVGRQLDDEPSPSDPGGGQPDDPVGGEDLFSSLEEAAGITTVAGYLEDAWAVTDALSMRLGVRALHADDLGTTVMPRFGARYAVSDQLSLTAGAGRYAQAIHSLRNEESILAAVMPYELLVAASPETGFLLAEDVVVGAEYRLPDTRLRVEAYAKRYPNLPAPPLAVDPLTAPVFAPEFRRGEGYATGLELFAQHRAGRSTVMGSYALTWMGREVDGVEFAPRFHRRHMLDVTGGLEVGVGGILTARVAAGTGQPYTPALARLDAFWYDPATGEYRRSFSGAGIVLGDHNSARLPGYLRMDLGARWETRKSWFGRDVTIVPYLQVLNVLGSRNVVTGSPQFDDFTGRAEIEYFPALPTLPTFGVEWRF